MRGAALALFKCAVVKQKIVVKGKIVPLIN
jgi:hypothetical protein